MNENDYDSIGMKYQVHIMSARQKLLLVAGCFSILSVCLSTWLIRQHQINMTNFSVQSKIVGIIWMIPIYAIDSYLSLVFPTAALYIDMLRDCYEAYVLYLFLSLMLSFLNSGESQEDEVEGRNCEDDLIDYLETKEPPPRLPVPFSIFYPGDLPKGRDFLRFCKFGTLQYCVFRPLTTLIAILLDRLGLYHEASIGPNSGWLYLTILVNISIAFAFAALATFYTTLKKKLAPYEPVGKFLCIKFVIFFAFWQSVIIAILVRIGSIHAVEGYTTHNLARGLQDTLICGEMFLVSIAHLYTFSYRPFTEDGRREKLLLVTSPMEHSLSGPLMSFPTHLYREDVKEQDGNARKKRSFLPQKVRVSRRGGGGPADNNSTPLSTHGDIHRNTDPTISSSSRSSNGYDVAVPIPRNSGTSEDAGFRAHVGIVSHTAHTVAHGSNLTLSSHNIPFIPVSSSSSSISSSRTTIQSAERTDNQSNGMLSMLDRNFASNAAVRDFNESMPVIVLPSNFTPEKGRVALSRPSDRVTE